MKGHRRRARVLRDNREAAESFPRLVDAIRRFALPNEREQQEQIVAVMPVNRTTAEAAERGDLYLVDVGALILVPAASPRDAVHLANAENLRAYVECCAPHPTVYQLDAQGNAVAVFD